MLPTRTLLKSLFAIREGGKRKRERERERERVRQRERVKQRETDKEREPLLCNSKLIGINSEETQ